MSTESSVHSVREDAALTRRVQVMTLARRRRSVLRQLYGIVLFSVWIAALSRTTSHHEAWGERIMVGVIAVGLWEVVGRAIRETGDVDWAAWVHWGWVLFVLALLVLLAGLSVVTVHGPASSPRFYPRRYAGPGSTAVARLGLTVLLSWSVRRSWVPLVDRSQGALLSARAACWSVRLTLLVPFCLMALGCLPDPPGIWLDLRPVSWVLAIGSGLVLLAWIRPRGFTAEMAQLLTLLIGMEWLMPVTFVGDGRSEAPGLLLIGSVLLCWYLLTRSRPLE